ncbi:hypothetical protein ACFZDK_53460 [Streptomyces sp. NPDC007901]|uniref:hypothetical protein n=1 Tax=Streptomyces sp. NPDC007901 TaxID=3364785 RepID=UPI0036F070E2
MRLKEGQGAVPAMDSSGAAGLVEADTEQVQSVVPQVAAAQIYMDYQQTVFSHWPQLPPPGLKVAVHPETVGQALERGAVMVTLNVPDAVAEPAGAASVPALLADPGLDLTDTATLDALDTAQITPGERSEAAMVQDGYLAMERAALAEEWPPMLSSGGSPSIPPAGPPTAPELQYGLPLSGYDPADTFSDPDPGSWLDESVLQQAEQTYRAEMALSTSMRNVSLTSAEDPFQRSAAINPAGGHERTAWAHLPPGSTAASAQTSDTGHPAPAPYSKGADTNARGRGPGR